MTGDFYNWNGENTPTGIQPDAVNSQATRGLIPCPRMTTTYPIEGDTYNIIVNKKTHRLRFQDEAESSVVVGHRA